jgi:hypothetical protein
MFFFPSSPGVVACNVLLLESNVVELPFSGGFGHIGQVDLDLSEFIDIAHSEIKFIVSLRVFARFLGE